ncbi:MAG: hypothetical protein K8R88_03595 [Armatimonadetes bacterium]|nr:hypothetical protein [Armatimonadota bacterium]
MIEMMATTTSNSIRVKALRREERGFIEFLDREAIHSAVNNECSGENRFTYFVITKNYSVFAQNQARNGTNPLKRVGEA